MGLNEKEKYWVEKVGRQKRDWKLKRDKGFKRTGLIDDIVECKEKRLIVLYISAIRLIDDIVECKVLCCPRSLHTAKINRWHSGM